MKRRNGRGTCPHCAAPVLWTENRQGKELPVDAEPNPLGSVRVWKACEDLCSSVPRRRGYERPYPDEERYTSHLVTCPSARRRSA